MNYLLKSKEMKDYTHSEVVVYLELQKGSYQHEYQPEYHRHNAAHDHSSIGYMDKAKIYTSERLNPA